MKRNEHSRWLLLAACLTVTLSPTGLFADTSLDVVQFNRDIRPILSDTCFKCHGPDATKRQAELRFDQEESALADRDGHAAIVPGRPEQSELMRRIDSADPDERMPPPDSGLKLSPQQIELLRRWIGQGAKWQPHWSFVPPQRPLLPEVKDATWPHSAIDRFVLARLEREGLKPSPAADPEMLIRRLTLDLTGLPPTPDEVEDFAQASFRNPQSAIRNLIDRLLASPRYGERMAARWLDAARYADTNGYQSDGIRHMWRWRDWVIDAYNANLPFDRFTVHQLAGDMLPQPTLAQQIATGFNRNHRGNAEGGIIPEEYAVEYVVDRVETTSTVWLGLTMGCVRCHDHKYDPLAQREFYRLYAYFNSVPERGKAIKYGNSPPMIPAPTTQQQQALAALEDRVKAAARRCASLEGELAAAQAKWEQNYSPAPGDELSWFPERSLVLHWPAPGEADGEFDGQRVVDQGDVGDYTFYDKFSLSAWIKPADERGGTIVSRMTDEAQGDGYYLVLSGGKLQVNLVKRWLDDAIRVETQEPLAPGAWHHVLAVYDGSRVASGVRVYVDGQPARLQIHLDDLNQSFATKAPLRIGGGNGPDGRFHGAISHVRVYNRALKDEEATLLATRDSTAEIVAAAASQRTPAQQQKLRAYYLQRQAPAALRQAWQELVALREERETFIEGLPTVMVMQELPQPRPAHVLLRGQYDKPGERVEPGVPARLWTYEDRPMPANRLAFARWLVDPQNPLTARVAVNRLWQMLFGAGLVKTVDDFGSQGEPPSHPELLDWLATEYIRLGWDTKSLIKEIVTSATYRQSSRATPQLLARDPENRLLARGGRVRLSAESIRDQALFASGLLVERQGGPSVKPYQPAGLWKELTGGEDYVPDSGENLYRRSLYTFWKRTIAPPTMMTFDAAGRETCVVRETRTNTPLQALALLNDVTFVEASRHLAQRMLREAGPTANDRLAYGHRLVLARDPRPAELAILHGGLQTYLERYRSQPQAAAALLSLGESKVGSRDNASELAAYTAVASLLFNLDEAITKE
jgi:hypothetical protein